MINIFPHRVEQEVSADSVEAKQLVSEQDITSATATVSDPQPTTSSSSSSSVTGVGAGAASGPLPSGFAYNVCICAMYTVRCHWKYLIGTLKSPL